MIYVSSIDKAKPGRFRVRPHGMLPDTLGSWVTAYIGKDSPTHKVEAARSTSDTIFPMAYSVEQDPWSHLRPHYHAVDQFQLVVEGSGTIGHHPVTPLSIHFTGPHSAYGPIKAGPEGIHYLTLRNQWDPGGRYLPEARHELQNTPHKYREVIAGPARLLAAQDLQRLTQSSIEALVEPQADGLAVWYLRIPAGQSIAGPDQSGSGGQFWVVLGGGAARAGEGLLAPLSCIFISAGESSPFSIEAGAEGLEIMVLQFPFDQAN